MIVFYHRSLEGEFKLKDNPMTKPLIDNGSIDLWNMTFYHNWFANNEIVKSMTQKFQCLMVISSGFVFKKFQKHYTLMCLSLSLLNKIFKSNFKKFFLVIHAIDRCMAK